MIVHRTKTQVYLFTNDIKHHYVQLKRQEDSPSLHVERRQWGRAWQGTPLLLPLLVQPPLLPMLLLPAPPLLLLSAPPLVVVVVGCGRGRSLVVIGHCWLTSQSVGRGR